MTNAHSAVVSVRYTIDDVEAAVAFYTIILVSPLRWILLPHLLRLLVALCDCCSVVKKALVGKRCLMEPNRCRGVGIAFNCLFQTSRQRPRDCAPLG